MCTTLYGCDSIQSYQKKEIITYMRKPYKWTRKNIDKAQNVSDVIDDLKNYLPLTLRQLYYRLVASGTIENNRSQYTMLSTLVKNMRLAGLMSWNVITDRTRRQTDINGYTNKKDFIDIEVNNFLKYYSRNLTQGQNKMIELWVEKDALATIFEDVAFEYSIRAVVCRGYQSTSFIKNYYDRAVSALADGKQPVILYFGDFDPSGIQMFEATQESLELEMNLYDIEYKRIALNLSDIDNYKLPNEPDAVKKTDTRYNKFVEKYGLYAVELDALHPSILKQIAVDAVKSELDMDMFDMEKEKQGLDVIDIELIRKDVLKHMNI